ncbi:MAG: cysteine desulfurase [Planctomycetes bacterium]|nr:cysteine desulfurase [Planctomycetota bacterium]
MSSIYLDNNATTPLLPEVLELVSSTLARDFGNPSSLHAPGQAARAVVNHARQQVAMLLRARSTEVVFTSGGTESINTAIHACTATVPATQRRVIRSSVEHEAVVEAARHYGASVAVIAVDIEGRLDLAQLERELKQGACCLSLMFSNNETGVTLPLGEAVRLAKAHGVPVHVDAVQAVGKAELDVEALGCDFLSIAGHKFHAPKGTGALFVRRSARFVPLMVGASQESSRRPGTENVAGLAGLGLAAEIMGQGIERRREHLAVLSREVERRLLVLPEARVQGVNAVRVPGTSNIAFPGIEGAGIVLSVARDGVAISSGSACSASSGGGSHVLEAMQVPYSHLFGAIRISCSERNTLAEVAAACTFIERAVMHLRGMLTAP